MFGKPIYLSPSKALELVTSPQYQSFKSEALAAIDSIRQSEEVQQKLADKRKNRYGYEYYDEVLDGDFFKKAYEVNLFNVLEAYAEHHKNGGKFYVISKGGYENDWREIEGISGYNRVNDSTVKKELAGNLYTDNKAQSRHPEEGACYRAWRKQDEYTDLEKEHLQLIVPNQIKLEHINARLAGINEIIEQQTGTKRDSVTIDSLRSTPSAEINSSGIASCLSRLLKALGNSI